MPVTLEQLRDALRRGTHAARPPPEPGLLLAAVAAVVAPGPPLQMLLIRRATSEGDPWSAHMALPGGKADPLDQSLLDTATRETLEEVGLDLRTSADYLGPLPVLNRAQQNRRVEIHPFVFALTKTPSFELNHEVDQALWVPLDALRDGSRDTTLVHPYGGRPMKFPAWEVEGHKVWGLTYQMLQSLLTLLKDPRHA